MLHSALRRRQGKRGDRTEGIVDTLRIDHDALAGYARVSPSATVVEQIRCVGRRVLDGILGLEACVLEHALQGRGGEVRPKLLLVFDSLVHVLLGLL